MKMKIQILYNNNSNKKLILKVKQKEKKKLIKLSRLKKDIISKQHKKVKLTHFHKMQKIPRTRIMLTYLLTD